VIAACRPTTDERERLQSWLVSDDGKSKQRRAERRRPGPLRVDLSSGDFGTLIDLSEFGALLELPTHNPVDSHLQFDLQSEQGAVSLQGRVVRSTPRYETSFRVTWTEPTSYHVAVEFFDLGSQCAMTLKDVLKGPGTT
jgi:hypothetical protein